jgi:hypothetical protein
MVAGNGHIKLLPVNINSTADKILDLVPELLCRLESLCKKRVSVRKEKEKKRKGRRRISRISAILQKAVARFVIMLSGMAFFAFY